VHRDLRDLPRVRGVMDALIRLFQEERAAIEGRRPGRGVGAGDLHSPLDASVPT
jgi:hypothetical protein